MDQCRGVISKGAELRSRHFGRKDPEQGVRCDSEDEWRKWAALSDAPCGCKPRVSLTVEFDVEVVFLVETFHYLYGSFRGAKGLKSL